MFGVVACAWLPAGARQARCQEAAPSAAEIPAPLDSAMLVRARALFAYAHYDRVLALLAPAIGADSAAAAEVRADALELLGRSQVRAGEVEAGVVTFERLLDGSPRRTLDPRWVADDERAVFARARGQWRDAHPDYVRAEMAAAATPRRRSWYRQRRFQLAGGAATAVVVAVIRHQASSAASSGALPDLPGHP